MIGRTFTHYLRVLLGSEQPQTQTSESERALLRAHLAGRKRIVEIGVFEGFTTRMLADNSDADATIYGVDPFLTGRVGISWGLQIVKAHMRLHIASGKVKLVHTFSTEAGDKVPTPVDYVFIDGDHSLEGITADWHLWSARVESGGIIALHDTLLPAGKLEQSELGSHQYFRSHIQHDRRFEIIGQQDSLSVLRKQ